MKAGRSPAAISSRRAGSMEPSRKADLTGSEDSRPTTSESSRSTAFFSARPKLFSSRRGSSGAFRQRASWKRTSSSTRPPRGPTPAERKDPRSVIPPIISQSPLARERDPLTAQERRGDENRGAREKAWAGQLEMAVGMPPFRSA